MQTLKAVALENMTKLILFLLLFMANSVAWSEDHYPGLQVDVKRDGRLYTFNASFDTPLTKCAAYHYLIDYEAARNLPGVVSLLAHRQSANKVKVEFTAAERFLFFTVQIISVTENTEKPFDGVSFIQLAGKSKLFQGSWNIESTQQGSTLKFNGVWEPSDRVPVFIVDLFIKGSFIDKFSAIAKLAEKRKDMLPANCADRL